MNKIVKGAVSGAMTGTSVLPGWGTAVGAIVGAGGALLSEQAQERALQGQALLESAQASQLNNIQPNNIFAMGGKMNYSQGGEMFSSVDAGGTHEGNPNGGVPVTDRALLEEGETKLGNKVFSNRLVIPEGHPLAGKTFAEASKKFIDNKRPNDPISKRYTEKELDKLFSMQEEIKGGTQEGNTSQTTPLVMSPGGIVPPKIPTSILDQAMGLNSVSELQTLPLGNSLNTLFTTPSITPQTFKTDMPSNTGIENTVSPEGAAFSPLRYAPIVGDAINIAGTIKNKPEPKALNMFDTNTEFSENLVNRDQIKRDITSAGGAARQSILDGTQGNAGAAIANMQGLNLGIGKNVAGAMLQANQMDSAEKARVQAANFAQDSGNMSRQMNVANMNDADKATYFAQLQDSIANMAQNVGNVGTEETFKSLVNNMFGYDVHGQYKLLKESGETALTFSEWITKTLKR